MTIIYVSDFDLGGSGYSNIAINLCSQLHNKDYEVMALGLGYKGQSHPYPFSIVPLTGIQNVGQMITNLQASNIHIEAIVVALDVPLQENIFNQLQNISETIPYIGLFPLEAGPVSATWAMNLLRMDQRLLMSKFAVEELAQVGVESQYIPIGIDTDVWRVPTPDERNKLRQGLGVEEEQCVILTVADNQERKNLSRSMEIFAEFSKERNALYWMVTRPKAIVGWNLEDYAMELGIMDRLVIWNRGMPVQQLWSLYATSDIMLLTSKAEGLAMPVLEAMSCRLPVVGTDCAAIREHLSDGRGLLIQPDYVMRDPWGNSRRYFADKDEGVYQLNLWQHGFSNEDCTIMLDKAQSYVQDRTWDEAGNVLTAAIEQVKKPIVVSQESIEQDTVPVVSPAIEKQPKVMRRRSKKKTNDLDIIIPVYGQANLLEVCLEKLEVATQNINSKTILVDDCGPEQDNLHRIYHSLNGQHKLIRNEQNSGFAKTVNRGVASGNAPLVLILNTDIELESDAINIMIAEFEDEKVGIVGPKLLFPLSSVDPTRPASKIQHAGLGVNLSGQVIHPSLGWDSDHPNVEFRRTCQAVTGACLMTRRMLWNRVHSFYKQSGDPTQGALNEVYGQGTYEDVEYCLAVRSEDYQVIYNPKAVAYHHVGASIIGDKKSYPLRRNEMIFNARCQQLLTWDEWTYMSFFFVFLPSLAMTLSA